MDGFSDILSNMFNEFINRSHPSSITHKLEKTTYNGLHLALSTWQNILEFFPHQHVHTFHQQIYTPADVQRSLNGSPVLHHLDTLLPVRQFPLGGRLGLLFVLVLVSSAMNIFT